MQRILWICLLSCAVLCTHCAGNRTQQEPLSDSGSTISQVRLILNKKEALYPTGSIHLLEPLPGAIYPRDMAPPEFEWATQTEGIQRWLIELSPSLGNPVYAFSNGSPWQPSESTWQKIKEQAGDKPVEIHIHGLGGDASETLFATASSRFYMSKDAVGAAILYRQLPLPYQQTEDYVRHISWKLGDVSDTHPPKTVMENQPVCSGCHQTSADGSLLAMEMNVAGDGGAHWVKPVSESMTITNDDVMTWTDYPKPPFFPDTRGSFAKLSPTGRFLVSPVNEISLMVLSGEPAYSQLFFPTFGFLGVYVRQDETFAPLTGAQDWDYVHTDPSWYPDESALLFSRAETANAYHPDLGDIKTQRSSLPIQQLNARFPIHFDIFRLPFNNGKGGEPAPLKGASNNGMSNSFARVSPDGKWVVFTQSRSGLMLQPDSALYIVPAGGGAARRMTCNRINMNSWHTWSPNGRWLAFASKNRSMYTELYLTHVDENGMDAPAIRLSRFSHPTMAANIPEFVPFKPDAIDQIRLQ